MTTSNLFLIGDVAGFSPHIGRLVSMMNYARHTTLAAVKGLTAEQLDHLAIDRLPRDMDRARSAVTAGTELAREAVLGLRWQRAGAV